MCRSTSYFFNNVADKDLRKHLTGHVMTTPAPFITVLLTFLSYLSVLLFVTPPLTRLSVSLPCAHYRRAFSTI